MVKIQSFHASVSCLPQNSDTRDSIPHLIQKKKKNELDKVIPPADVRETKLVKEPDDHLHQLTTTSFISHSFTICTLNVY